MELSENNNVIGWENLLRIFHQNLELAQAVLTHKHMQARGPKTLMKAWVPPQKMRDPDRMEPNVTRSD